MQIDRMVFPVTALGPGNRLGIWTIGCHKRCKKCANPELRAFDITKNISMDDIENMLKNVDFSKVDGVTISGGEPFAQPQELRKILKKIAQKVEDILVFSGYTYRELWNMNDSDIRECFQYIGVLILGEYIDELNDNSTALIASSNQKMYILNDSLIKKYQEYMKKGRQIQNVFFGENMMSIGIHNRERSV